MGKSKKVTVGYWYKPAYHAGLGLTCDAFLEFRGGDQTAWQGQLTESGTISINAPNLWGGEKDQGGIVGDVDVMFGEADQQVNPYLASAFGPQQSAWRGLTTLVFKGGKYGAMNPYPQKAGYKIRRILKGWDNDECWYPEKAAIPLDALDVPYDGMWAYKVELPGSTADYSSPTYDHSDWPVDRGGFGSYVPPGSGLANNTIVSGGVGRSIWIRREVEFVGQTTIDIYHDDGAWLWIDGEPITLTSITWFHSRVEVMFNGTAVIALKVTDGVPAGSNNIFAGMVFTGGTQDKLAMNPAHILYYSRTQSDMGREPVEAMNDASFRAAADWYHEQGFGLCTAYDPGAESVEEFEQRIQRVAGCAMTRSLVDGQWYLDVANGIYDLESLPILTDDDVLAFEEQPTLLDSAVNSVSVKYFDPEKKEAIITPPVQSPALITQFGTHHLTLEFPEIPSATLAARVAQRELQARATGLRGFPLKTTRAPYAWRPGTYFRLQLPKRRIADMVCIFSEKSSGQLRSGAMTITALQDVYNLPETVFVEVEEGVDTRPSQTPVPIVHQQAFEAPYIEVVTALSRADLEVLPAETSYLMAVAAEPAASRNYTLMVDTGTGYEESVQGEWTASAVVVEASGYEDQDFTLSNGQRLSEVAIGMAALWGNEIVRVDELNPITGAVKFGRGCADTVPVKHAASERIWFFQVGGAADVSEYSDGEVIDVKLLTNTGTQQLAIDLAATLEVEFAGRAARPYPPGQFRINGLVDVDAVVGDITVSGVHRDRVQQADQLVDASMAAIGPEGGTTYTVRYFVNGVLEHTDSGLLLPESTHTPVGAGLARVEMEAVRDGLASYQMHVREFSLGSPLQMESGALIEMENGEPILME